MLHTTASSAPWDFRRGAATIRGMVAAGADLELSEAALLDKTLLRPGDLQTAGLEVDACDELQVARNLVTLLGPRPGLGVRCAQHFSFSSLGLLGVAFLAAQTVREAIQLGIEALSLTYAFVKPLYVDDGHSEVVCLDDTSIPEDVRTLLVARDLTTFCRAWTVITGQTNGLHATVQLDDGEIAHLRSALPGFHIDAGARTILAFERAALDAAPSQSDPGTSRDLQPVISSMVRQRTVRQRFSSVVRSRIDASSAAPPTMERVAHELHIDTRTLRRRLAAEGTSYRSLVGDARASMAASLLTDPSLTIDTVANRLGYHDAAALSKASHRWFGQSPGTFRSTKRVMSIGE